MIDLLPPVWWLAPTTTEAAALTAGLRLAGAGAARCEVHRIGVGSLYASQALADRLDACDTQAMSGAVLLAGFAGGLRAGQATGDIVVATAHASIDAPGAPLLVDAELREWLGGALTGAGVEVESGALLTSNGIVDEDEQRRRWSQQGFVAAEMEGHGLARVCGAAGIPFAALRVVLDPPGFVLPDLTWSLTPDGRPRVAAITARLLHSPALLPALIRVARASRVAAAVLSNAAAVSGAVPR